MLIFIHIHILKFLFYFHIFLRKRNRKIINNSNLGIMVDHLNKSNDGIVNNITETKMCEANYDDCDEALEHVVPP